MSNEKNQSKLSSPDENRAQWYVKSFFNMHIDYHSHWDVTYSPYSGADEDEIFNLVQLSKPTAVQFSATDNPGMSYYPTKIGRPHPNLGKDILSLGKKVAGRGKMKFLVYYNSGRQGYLIAVKRPEYSRIDVNGKKYPNMLCFNSGVVEDIIVPQVREIIEKYHPDGFWFDGSAFTVNLCYCDRCCQLFKKRYGVELPRKKEDPRWKEWVHFHQKSFVRAMRKIADTIHTLFPQAIVNVNWAYSLIQPEPPPDWIDWLSGDVHTNSLVQGLYARYYTTTAKPYDIMTCIWNYPQEPFFDTTGIARIKAGQPKSFEQAAKEAAVVIANGARWFAWDNPEKNGSLDPARQKRIAEVARFIKKRQTWSHRTKSVSEVAVLHSASTHYAKVSPISPRVFPAPGASLLGVYQALIEAHIHFDLLNEKIFLRDASKYRALLLPEQTVLAPEIVTAIRLFVEGGGTVFATGLTSLDKAGKWLLLSDMLGIELVKANRFETAFVLYDGQEIEIAQPWHEVKPTTAKVLYRLKGNRLPAVTVNKFGNGSVAYIASDFFSHYTSKRKINLDHIKIEPIIDEPLLRQLFQSIIYQEFKPMLRTDAPYWVEVALREKDGDILIHLINRSCEWAELKSNKKTISIDLEMPNEPVKVHRQPGNLAVEWTWTKGRLYVEVPPFRIHTIIEVKKNWDGSR